MRHAEQLERLRSQVRLKFQEMGAVPAEDFQETILIRDGHYCGRRFRSDHHHAIWFIEENELKFYGPDGCVLAVGPLPEPETTAAAVHQRAA